MTCDGKERARAPRTILKPVLIQTSTPVLLVCEGQDKSAVMQLAQALIVGDAEPELIVIQRGNLVELDISLAAQTRPSVIVPCVAPILEKKVRARVTEALGDGHLYAEVAWSNESPRRSLPAVRKLIANLEEAAPTPSMPVVPNGDKSATVPVPGSVSADANKKSGATILMPMAPSNPLPSVTGVDKGSPVPSFTSEGEGSSLEFPPVPQPSALDESSTRVSGGLSAPEPQQESTDAAGGAGSVSDILAVDASGETDRKPSAGSTPTKTPAASVEPSSGAVARVLAVARTQRLGLLVGVVIGGLIVRIGTAGPSDAPVTERIAPQAIAKANTSAVPEDAARGQAPKPAPAHAEVSDAPAPLVAPSSVAVEKAENEKIAKEEIAAAAEADAPVEVAKAPVDEPAAAVAPESEADTGAKPSSDSVRVNDLYVLEPPEGESPARWLTAALYCKELVAEGSDLWRLPARRDFRQIFEMRPFPAAELWSSSKATPDGKKAFLYHQSRGFFDKLSKHRRAKFVCVRDAETP